MAALNAQRPSAAGTTITLAAASVGGDSFPNDGSTTFRVKNGGVGSINVTFVSPNACSFGVSGGGHHDLVVAVGAGADLEIGPFSQARYNDTSNRVQVTYSGVTSVTVAAIAR
jgi:hypothetical protein